MEAFEAHGFARLGVGGGRYVLGRARGVSSPVMSAVLLVEDDRLREATAAALTRDGVALSVLVRA